MLQRTAGRLPEHLEPLNFPDRLPMFTRVGESLTTSSTSEFKFSEISKPVRCRLVVIGHYWRRFLDEVHPKVFEKHPCRSSIRQDGQLHLVHSDSGFLQIKRPTRQSMHTLHILAWLFLTSRLFRRFKNPFHDPSIFAVVRKGFLPSGAVAKLNLGFCKRWLMEPNPGSLNKNILLT